ncbi:MAG: chorismate synthase [Ruminococcaceae bacterium]|nr:chorismate synthase [Oscillospiraceae bacterium]
MSMTYGENVKMTVFGQSHAEKIGVIIEGLPKGTEIDFDYIKNCLSRRAPGKNAYSTPRKEADEPIFESGVENGVTTGEEIKVVIKNTNTRSSDYEKLKLVPRPGHADYTAFVKENGNYDVRGGGAFSGRMTAPLVIAGAIASSILKRRGIEIGAHILKIRDISDSSFDSVAVSEEELETVKNKEFPVIDDKTGERMIEEILGAKAEGDSVGGVIECAVVSFPAGIGSPMFDGLENVISRAVFAVPAVKGIEFGSGFSGSGMLGSENNDAFTVENGKIKTVTNNHGGILGGISSGMPLVFRVAVKPTPSISKKQQSVNLKTLESETLEITGRHDPCIVPRAVPVIEAVTAFCLYDLMRGEGKI